MNKRTLLLVFIIITGISLSAQVIPDDNFRLGINQELNQPDDYDPTIEDLNSLTGWLSIMEAEIESIEGAQYLTGIYLLDLGFNDIND